MQTSVRISPRASTPVWVGWALTTVAVLFMTFDGITKLLRIPQVVQATTVQLGFPQTSIPTIGLMLLACTALYIVPSTAVLGAVLLTGYLGGATAANVRVGDPLFETIFPILFAFLVWAALIVREDRLRALLPFRQ